MTNYINSEINTIGSSFEETEMFHPRCMTITAILGVTGEPRKLPRVSWVACDSHGMENGMRMTVRAWERTEMLFFLKFP